MSNSNNRQFQPNGFYQSHAIDVACVIVIVAYFLHFALPSLAGGFAEDEMMNIYWYWAWGAQKLLWANICFWSFAGRPLGALYYLPLYHFFSLNPEPYRIVQITILAASIPIAYYLAWLLAASRSVAFLAVLALCYHARLLDLVFIGSFIYDVLCGFFYFAALIYYMHIREKGLPLHPIQLLTFLVLYVCALNAKEMAVTLPVIVLGYELLKYYHGSERQRFFRSILRNALPALVAGLLTAIYCYKQIRGPGSYVGLEAYTPHYSWHRFIESNAHFVNQLFYLSDAKTYYMAGMTLLAAWSVVFVYAFLRRDRMLQLMAFWIVITPLPLAFIPLRGGACLYILLFGWAMIFAKLISDLIGLLSKSSIFVRQRMGGDVFRIYATIVVACAVGIFTQWENQRFRRIPVLLSIGQKTSQVIQAFRSLDLHPAPGSTILLMLENRLYEDGYYPMFVASLVWNDRSLRIYVAGRSKLTEQDIAKMNYIISLNEFQAKLFRAPNSGDL